MMGDNTNNLPLIMVAGVHTDEVKERFQNLPACRVVFAEKKTDMRPEDLAETELFVGIIPKDLPPQMPKLRFVQLLSAGANTFDFLPENVVLANAYGAYGDAIAEHLLTTTMMALKRMPEYMKGQEEQKWQLLDNIGRIEGSKVLSVGMGAIGTSYCRMTSALGATCYGVRRTIHDKPDFVEKLVTPDGMDELLPEMDIVALSLPGTAAVKDMFDERRLRLMKKGAIILNVGRGNSIVTEDLIKVMNEGHLKAACLDVMDPEPLPKDHPLWTTPRVYITPHISGGFRAGVNYDRVMDRVFSNVELVLDGKPPVHIVDRELGY